MRNDNLYLATSDVPKYLYVELFSESAKSLSLINVPLITHAVQRIPRVYW